MTKRLLNSVKNERARKRYFEMLAKANEANMGAVNKEIDRQANAWQDGPSAGGDVVYGDREAPSMVFRPKKGGGGRFFDPQSNEVAVKDDAEEREVASLLRASGGVGEAKTGADFDADEAKRKQSTNTAESGRAEGREKLRSAGLGGLADLSEGAENLGLSKGADWLFEEMGKTEAPKNLGQWLVNLLSTGTYVGARAAEGVGAAAEAVKQREQENGPSSGSGLQGLAESFINAGGGAARGVAEGLGFRFDGERPRTWGQNLESVGTDDFLRDTLGEDAGNVAQGALGTVADIGLDPTTYLTLGATGVGKGAVQGAKAAAAGAKTTAGRVARGGAGAVRGGFEGAAKRRAELAAERADAWLARDLRRRAGRGEDIGGTGFTPQLELEELRAIDDAAAQFDAPEPESGLFVGAENGDVFRPADLDLRNPQLALPAKPSDYRPGARSVEDVQAGARLLDPVLRATDELAPSLRGTVQPPKLNLSQLLAGGSRAVTTKVPLIDSQGSAAMAAQITGVVSAVKNGADVERAIAGAMGQLERVPSVAARLDTIADTKGSTVRDLIEAAMRGNAKAADQVSKLWRRQIDETAQVVNTPALREAIDAVAPGLREGLGVEKAKLHRLVSKLNRTADPTAQQEALGKVLGKSYERGYAGFREALAGVARGEISPEQMMQMLSALGIKTRATKPATLRELLNTRGAMAYDEALAKIPTPEQVRAQFNLSDETVARMATVDPDVVLAQTDEAADAAVAAADVPEVAGVDFPATDIDAPAPKPVKPPKPPVTPQRRPFEFTGHDVDASGPGRNSNPNPVGKAIYAGVQRLGRLLKEATEEGKRGNTLTSYTDEVSTEVHRAVVEQLKMPYLKKGGADRAERFLPRWLEAMDVVDAWARGKGMFPHLVDNANGTGPIWVSPTQVLKLLPGDVVGAALFAPVKTRGSRASEEAIGYVNGMTVYPNHVMAGLKVALSGGTSAQVAKIITDRAVGASRGMQRGTDRYVKAFAETKAGRAAIDDLAAEMVQPYFLDQVHAIDATVRPVAEAISQRYIDNVVARVGERLIETLKDGGDRGTLMKVLDEVSSWADDATRPALLEADRISATVRERLDSAIVRGILGEEGFLTAQHDWAFATALETMTGTKLADAQAAALAREQARLSSFRPAGPGKADDLRPHPELVAERGRVAVAAGEEIDEAFQRVVADVEEELQAGAYADLPEELFTEADARISHGLFEALGSRLSGRFGQRDLWAGRTSAEEGTRAQAAHYTDKMMRWIDTVAERMGVKPQEALDHLNGPVFRALAATDPANWGSTGKIYTELRAGRRFPDTDRPALADGGVFAALDDFDAKLGVEMMKFIDHVFNPNPTGMLGRSGIAAEDLVDASKWHLRGDFERFRLDPGEALTEQAQKWRAWGVADSPLDIIDRTHRAIQAALVPQQIGHSLAPLFGHKALRPGVPTKQLYAEGWRKIDTTEARGIGRFADRDAYFPPHILEQLRYVDDFLAASRGFDPDGFVGRLLIRPVDAVTHVLKSMNTIWRLGHHVTNVLGEFGMLLMAGVNPLQANRAVKTIRAGGGAIDADMSVLDDLVREASGGKVPDPKFAEESVSIVLRDGRGGHKIEKIPLKTVWEWAVNSGVALTHTAARDLMDDLSAGVGRNFWNSNPLARADQTLGQFSATRDNVTRLAHFIDALEKGTFANVDQARAAAQTKVHDYHPTVRTLSRFEQKYVRRIVFFYTWVRQAISRVLRTAMDQPGLVTMPFKAQYNMAEANGLNPESIGGPTTDDPRTASYTDNSLLGPTMALPGAEGDPDNLWAWSLSSPQIDTLQALFGTFNQRPPTGNPVDDAVNNTLAPAAQLAGDVANPALTILPETVAGLTGFGTGKGFSEIASESAGLPTALARSLPAGLLSGDTDSGSVYSAMFPESSGARKTPEEQKSEMQRYLVNLITGLKFQNTTTPASEKRAKRELRDEVKRRLAEQGIDDPDTVSEIRDQIWEQRVAERTRG